MSQEPPSQMLSQIRKLATEVSEREDCFLYDLEFHGKGSQRVLRVYIDSEKGGVSIDQCANVSRGLSLVLDVEDLIPGQAYELEVSSPGLERVLREPWHFEKALGSMVKVRAREALELPEKVAAKHKGKGKLPIVKQLQGHLQSLEGSDVLVESDSVVWRIPMSHIHRAQIVFDFNEAKQGKK